MARWLVRLVGEQFDVEELPRWFPSGEVFAVREGEYVYLTGPALEHHKDAGEVVKVTRKALDELSAVISLLVPNYQKPTIDTSIIREDDDGCRLKHHVLEAEPGRIRIKGTATLTVKGQARPSTTMAQDLLAASKRSPHLARALALLSRSDASWPHLYVALEEVEQELRAASDAAGLCSSGERDRFRSTANNAESAGHDARHASGKFTAPRRPMTLAQAREFVRKILEAALSGHP